MKIKILEKKFLLLLTVVLFMNVGSASGAKSLQPNSPSNDNYPADSYDLYLPTILNGFPRPQTVFGAESTRSSNLEDDFSKARQANVYWLRSAIISWKDIEPTSTTPPTYIWDPETEAMLIEAANKDLKVIATIKYTPDWAQKISGLSCGPIAEHAFDEFSQFVKALVSKYGFHPYNVKYWEFLNEADGAPDSNWPDRPYGCWGDPSDNNFYGGEYYAEALKYAYMAIKEVDPNAKVLTGGFLLDCDPTNPPPGRNCTRTKFFEGILDKYGGNYFDIVSYHGYSIYKSDGTILDETNPEWYARGGVVLGKADYLEEVMASYGVNKPLMLTEGGLICPETLAHCDPPSSNFFETQADYVVRLFTKSWGNNFLGTIWYSIADSWRYNSLLESNGDPKPAYHAYKYMTARLQEASFSKIVNPHSKVTGYEFIAAGKPIWVLWSTDYTNHTISVTGNPNVYDKYGNSYPISSGNVTINKPVYIVW